MRAVATAAKPPRHEHADLLRALAVSLRAAGRAGPLSATSLSLSLLGAIDLPDGGGQAMDPGRLRAAAPLYFASELEQAGLLPTAELVAGLFASGAITQPLGPAARLLNDFWRNRRERLDARERQAIFDRVIEQPYFDQLLGRVCEAIVAQADGSDFRERVALESATTLMAEFLDHRLDPMAAMAAGDFVVNIQDAIAFMRDRMLQVAFGTQSLWQLVAVAGASRGLGASRVQRHVDQGRSGQAVLLWLAGQGRGPAPRVDPGDHALIGSAHRWLAGRQVTPAARLTAAA